MPRKRQKKSWTKKESDGPDGKTVLITDHLPSRCQCRRVLRGKLPPLVNGYPFTRMAEWSNLHMWRRRRPKSWVRTQPNPLFLCKEMCVKNTFFATEKTKKILDKKESDGPDGKTVLITDHLPSRCQCRRVLRGKLLPLVNGYYYFVCHPTISDESNQTFIRHDDIVLLPGRMHP